MNTNGIRLTTNFSVTYNKFCLNQLTCTVALGSQAREMNIFSFKFILALQTARKVAISLKNKPMNSVAIPRPVMVKSNHSSRWSHKCIYPLNGCTGSFLMSIIASPKNGKQSMGKLGDSRLMVHLFLLEMCMLFQNYGYNGNLPYLLNLLPPSIANVSHCSIKPSSIEHVITYSDSWLVLTKIDIDICVFRLIQWNLKNACPQRITLFYFHSFIRNWAQSCESKERWLQV